MIRLRGMACLVIYPGSVAADEASDALTHDVKKLEGTWNTSALSYDRKNCLANGKSGFNFVFNGNEATAEGNDAVKKEYAKIRAKLDWSTTPKFMDITVAGGIQDGAVIDGIYELKDDELLFHGMTDRSGAVTRRRLC